MADNKTLNTRLVNKHDVEANWLKAVNFIPLQGEIIVYDIDENYSYERFKIGDGATNISALPFVEDIFKNNLNIKNGTGEKAIQQDGNTASGDHSVAFGVGTVASGNQSVAMGIKTEATEDYGIVVGKFNETAPGAAVVVGNGNASVARSNAATIDWDGNAWFAGNVSVGENKVLATQEYVDSKTLTDTTLTIEGAPADAKAAGDAIKEARIRAEIALLDPNIVLDPDVEIYYDPNKTEIGEREFNDDDSMEVAYFPNVEKIGTWAFRKASATNTSKHKLKAAIFPKAKEIGKQAFRWNTALEFVYAPEAENIVSAFEKCGIKIADFPKAKTLEAHMAQCFAGCTSLTDVNMPSLETIEEQNAFDGCTSLINIYMPKLTSANGRTFVKCTALGKVDFPLLMSVPTQMFRGCTALTTVILRNSTVVTLEDTTAFAQTPIESGTGYIYVPSALIEDYKVATNWSAYAAQFRALEDYTVDGTITGELDDFKVKMTAAIDPTLTISGAPADAKVVGDLWRAYPTDADVWELLINIGLYERIADENGNVLTDEADAILLI